jgi:single-stranded-DNA-specific exonuclease
LTGEDCYVPRIERRAVVSEAAWTHDLHPVLRQVLSRRQIESQKDLELKLEYLVPVGQFDALEEACDLLVAHMDGPVIVVGDFDADGATSSALAVLCLRHFGFRKADFFIPDRFTLGYGLSEGVVDAVKQRAPGLIVTVDNGISSTDGVIAAKRAGFDVLVTDHHLPPEALPVADVIVNPNLPGTAFPSKSLAGVGVVFYLMAALGRRLAASASVAEYLDLVALGTVADLVPLDHQNRILVEQGIRRIRAGRCRPGVQALIDVAGCKRQDLTAQELGFQLAPRLNAAGRLDDMSIGVRCLLSDRASEARSLAQALDRLNLERRQIEAKMKVEALALVDELDIDTSGTLPAAICMQRESWHEGLVGLIASRVKDRVHRPVFAFAPTGRSELKGSGRSIRGFHLRDALAEVDASEPGLLRRYGGHAMAAGLNIAAADFDRFEAALAKVADRRISPDALQQTILSDGELAPEHLVLDVAQLLREATPWGQSFPEPCFDGMFGLIERRVLKDQHLKLKLEHGGVSIDAIAFFQADADWSEGQRRRIAYRLAVNDFNLKPRVQLIIEHIADESETSI